MALPTTGPISFADIMSELGVLITPFSIRQAELGNYSPINQNSTSKPDGSAPHSVSEWRGYNHNAISIDSFKSFSSWEAKFSASEQCQFGIDGTYYEHNGDFALPQLGDTVRRISNQSLLANAYVRFGGNSNTGFITNGSGTVIDNYTCGSEDPIFK